MANFFPRSYGEIDLSKAGHKAMYLNVNVPGLGMRPCLCFVDVSANDDYIRLWTDKDGNTHPCVNVSMDDATALNEYSRNKAAAEGKQYTDFHGQFHIDPRSDVFKRLFGERVNQIVSLYATDRRTYDALREKYGLDDKKLAEWKQRNPQSYPDTVEKIAERIARQSFQRESSAGRIYCPSLNAAPPMPTQGEAQPIAIPAPAPAFTPAAQPSYAPQNIPAAADEPDNLPF